MKVMPQLVYMTSAPKEFVTPENEHNIGKFKLFLYEEYYNEYMRGLEIRKQERPSEYKNFRIENRYIGDVSMQWITEQLNFPDFMVLVQWWNQS